MTKGGKKCFTIYLVLFQSDGVYHVWNKIVTLIWKRKGLRWQKKFVGKKVLGMNSGKERSGNVLGI